VGVLVTAFAVGGLVFSTTTPASADPCVGDPYWCSSDEPHRSRSVTVPNGVAGQCDSLPAKVYGGIGDAQPWDGGLGVQPRCQG
jgi:hypothetical protein